MVEVTLKSDPLRPGWYILEEAQPPAPSAGRGRSFNRAPIYRPPTDVFETEEAVVVRVEIAGMQEKEFSIALSDRLLSIRGARSDVVERRAYYQMEIMFGEFLSEVELPNAVQPEKAKAEYRAGFLRLELPKVQPQRIRVQEK